MFFKNKDEINRRTYQILYERPSARQIGIKDTNRETSYVVQFNKDNSSAEVRHEFSDRVDQVWQYVDDQIESCANPS